MGSLNLRANSCRPVFPDLLLARFCLNAVMLNVLYAFELLMVSLVMENKLKLIRVTRCLVTRRKITFSHFEVGNVQSFNLDTHCRPNPLTTVARKQMLWLIRAALILLAITMPYCTLTHIGAFIFAR